jgi:zinc protease
MTSLGLRALAAAFLFLTTAPALADTPIPAGAAIAPDPAVRFGALANGLRYAIMPNKGPAGAISIRLVMKVGSFDEADDELGYAHFIEHMTFRSTRQAPGGTLDNPFAAYGVALGRDQNAATMLDTTIFEADLPASGSAGLRPVLDWMREAVEEVDFTPAAVDSERGVVIAELQSRNGPIAEMQNRMERFQMGALRSGNRDPGGTTASLAAAPAARLKRFYDRWYRPENAILVIVGDAPADDLQRLVEQEFAGWKGRGPAGVRPAAPATLVRRGIEAMTVSGPSLPSLESACRVHPRPAGGTPLERLRREAYTQLWTRILNERFKHLATSAGSTLLGAEAVVNDDLPDAEASCLLLAPASGKWREALHLAQAEWRRFGKDGPTLQELSDALGQIGSALGGSVEVAATRMSSTIAPQIAAAMVQDRPFGAPIETLKAFRTAVAGVTIADVGQAFDRDWSGSGPLLTAAGPAAPAKAALIAAWQANEAAAPLAAYADREAATWLYRDFGAAGTVDRREARPDFVRLHFRNGVWLNFKQTRLQANQVEVRIRFGTGESGLAVKARAATELAATLFAEGGLGRMDYEQIESAFAGTTWSFGLETSQDAFELSAHPLTDQVQGELQLLAAYMTDPGFRSNLDGKLPTAVDTLYRVYRTEPAMVATDALEHRLFGDRASLPPREQTARLRARDFAALLKPILTGAPAEVTIVGDISEAEARVATAKTFGALPPRPPMPRPAGDGPFRRFPAQLPPPILVYHEGPADKAAAILMWPLYVARPERRMEEYALSLTTSVFRARLFQKVRVEMGKVYDPDVGDPMPDFADQGFLSVTLAATPADLDSLVAATRKIAADLAGGSITQAEIDRERRLLVAARLDERQRNAPWANAIAATRDESVAMDELLAYPDQMAALTLEDVRKAAATWLKAEPAIVRALPRPAGKAAAR